MKTTLKDLRKENGKTAAEVAAALGVTEQAVRHYENGIRSIGLEQVLKISELYSCSVEEVIYAQLNSFRCGR